MELVVNHSWRFYESKRSIDTFCSVPQRTGYPEKNKNWRTADSVVNPSWRFYKSPRRFGKERINT